MKLFGNRLTLQNEDLPQILAIFICSLAGFTFGLGYSWSSPSIVNIVNDHVNYNISYEEASYFPVLPPVAMIITSTLLSSLNDQIGRKNTILLIAIPYIIAYLLIAFFSSLYVLYIARFITGIGDSFILICMPMYIGEISTPAVRGTWGNVFTIVAYTGEFIINVLESYFSVQHSALICLIFPIIFLLLFSFLPESPYYLLMKNKHEDAKKSLKFLRAKQNVDNELRSLQIDVARQLSESATMKDLFNITSNKRAILCASFLRISQLLSGNSAFLAYTKLIFIKSNSNLSSNVSSMIAFAIIPIFSIFAIYTVDALGRKKSHILSLFFCSIALFIEVIYFSLEQFATNIDLTPVNWIPLFGIVLYYVSFSIGIGVVPTLMLSELFSTSIKGKALVLMIIVFGTFIIFTTKLFQILEVNVGLFCPFAFFGVCSVISIILSFKLIPETKNKTLEEIQQILKQNK